MPRRTRTRATRGPSGLDPAIASYLLDGDHRAALDSRKARSLPLLPLFRKEALKPLWLGHRAELLAEAKRRGIARPWAVRELDGWPKED
jgi:hypothetical protein